MKILMKKLCVVAMALLLVFSLTGCSSSEKDKTPETTPAAKAEGELSDEDYKSKVTEISDNITVTSQEGMSAIDQTDMDKTVEALTALLKKVRPMYEELGALKAPESFADAQEKIKSGADASVDLLDLSIEIFELQKDPSQEDAVKKLEKLQTKLADYTAKAQELNTGISMVTGGTAQ